MAAPHYSASLATPPPDPSTTAVANVWAAYTGEPGPDVTDADEADTNALSEGGLAQSSVETSLGSPENDQVRCAWAQMRAEGAQLRSNSRRPTLPKEISSADIIGFDSGVNTMGTEKYAQWAPTTVNPGMIVEDVMPSGDEILPILEFPGTAALNAALSQNEGAGEVSKFGYGELVPDTGRVTGNEPVRAPSLTLNGTATLDEFPTALLNISSGEAALFDSNFYLNTGQNGPDNLIPAENPGHHPLVTEAGAREGKVVDKANACGQTVVATGQARAVGQPVAGYGGSPGEEVQVDVAEIGKGIEEDEVVDLDDPETEARLEKSLMEINKRAAERKYSVGLEKQKQVMMQERQRQMLSKAHAVAQAPWRGTSNITGLDVDDNVVVIDSDDDDDVAYDVEVYSSIYNNCNIGELEVVAPPMAGFSANGMYSSHNDYAGYTGIGLVPATVKPEEEFDKKVIKQLVDNHNMSADATEEIDDPSELAVSLLRHQKRAVAWMQKRETIGSAPVAREEKPSVLGISVADNDSEDSDFEAAPDPDDADGKDGEATCRGGILADEQGLGKTLSVIALMVASPPPPVDGRASKWRSLVVCPVSLVGQWKEEIETRIKLDHRPTVYIYHGPKRIRDPAILSQFDVVVTTYTTLTKEYPKVLRDADSYAELKKAKLPVPRRSPGPLYQCKWHRAVLDESHQIKNRRTEGFAAASSLPVSIRWCLTGTPIQNSVDDIYSLFAFIRYKFLPKMSYKQWNESWKRKLESTHALTRSRAFKRFQPVVAAVTLRRTKMDTIEGKELITLPSRTVEVKETDFRMASEALKYQELKASSHSEINRLKSSDGGLRRNYTGIMLLLLRLRQSCCHPFLADYAASKQRGRNGDGGTRFLSPYSVNELDEAQLLVESGIAGFNRLDERVRSSVLQKLAPQKPLPPPELDLYRCERCRVSFVCNLLRILPSGVFICRSCADFIMCDDNISADTDPFMELDDIRREVHVRLRSDFVATQKKSGHKRTKASRETVTRKRPRSSELGHEPSSAQLSASFSSSPLASTSSSPGPSEEIDAQSDVTAIDPRMRQPSTKISIILETVRSMRDRDANEKCLVFSQWTSMLDIISFHMKEAGFTCCRLDGTMSMLKRKEQVQKFRSDPSVTIFLLSMHAAGTGLNLTQANNVILADAWWNPSVEAQCCDRAHRIGQTRPVQITRLKIKGTCEEKIYELCARKAETCASALGDSGGKSSGRQKLTLEDAVALFGSENDELHIPLGPGADDTTRAAISDVGKILGQGSNQSGGYNPP